MYKDFYRLKETPFNVTSDPDFYFSSTHHNEAYSHLVYGIKDRKGILVITGEVGTGKTTICRTLLNHLDDNIKTAFILNPRFSDLQLLQMIIKDLGAECKQKNKFALINALNDFLLEQTGIGNNVIIIIDEAQNLKVSQLEQIRLLSNLETEKEKLLQIILVGQPELVDKLKLPELRQLNQRISVRFHIKPLEKEELKDYIYHRIKVASVSRDDIAVSFTNGAIRRIFEYSEGTPRVINILCDRALLAGFVAETFQINAQIIDSCAEEIAQI